jgi:hypothetical protein
VQHEPQSRFLKRQQKCPHQFDTGDCLVGTTHAIKGSVGLKERLVETRTISLFPQRWSVTCLRAPRAQPNAIILTVPIQAVMREKVLRLGTAVFHLEAWRSL